MYRLCILAMLVVLNGCGRYFAGPLRPTDHQADTHISINDDRSLTYTLNRFEINLRPMTDTELNRQFSSVSQQGARSTNPYTFGDWTPIGEDWTPPRFTVFRLMVKNYEFPKVMVDTQKMTIVATNGRRYEAMNYAQLEEYFRAYWLGRTGRGREEFRSRVDLLRRTMYASDFVFSGQEREGFVVFPVIDDDVREIAVHLKDIAVRFDFADQPVETVDLALSFERDVFQAYSPPPELVER